MVHWNKYQIAQLTGYKLLMSYCAKQNQIELKEQMQAKLKQLQPLLKLERIPILDEEFIDYYFTALEHNNQEDFIRFINTEFIRLQSQIDTTRDLFPIL